MTGSTRMLVAIANHGTKNQPFLARLLDEYRSMRHDVDVVVLSDAPKDLGPDVEVRVGAPTSNPWSLPFAHRSLFTERAGDYDLFVYSEDDTLLTQQHVDAFLEVDALLPDDAVPGFLRYEEYPDHRRSYCSIHSGYRWDPDSVVTRGGEVFASYTNQHAACYVLTRDQLQRVIRSGKFLTEPHEGAYDMLVSAATDPYTRCGLERLLCVSRIDDFLLAHLPNVYLDRLGVEEEVFRAQVRTILDIGAGRVGRNQLLDPTSRLATAAWDVPQHPRDDEGLAALLPCGPVRALSIGCTAGAMERRLLGDEASIVGLPVDEVAGAVARIHGIQTLPADFDALDELTPGRFDVVLAHQVLHHVAEPVRLLCRLKPLVRPGGRLVVSLPNVRYQRLRARAGRPAPPVPRSGFSVDGIHAPDTRTARHWANGAGFRVERMQLTRSPRLRRAGWLPPAADSWLAANFTASLVPAQVGP